MVFFRFRPLTLLPPPPGVTVAPLFGSSKESYARAVPPVEERQPVREPPADAAAAARASTPGRRLLGVAVEGTWPDAPATAGAPARPFRAVIVGDGDFASNSFFPYMLMSEKPAQVDRVELTADGRRSTFVRTASGGWQIGAGPGAADLAIGVAAHLETSIKFMHVSAPVRTLSRDEYQAALGEYGLDPPRYTVALHAGGRPVLAARFGAKNPQKLFQYVQVEGRAALYLVPVFVGQEWERVLDAIKTS